MTMRTDSDGHCWETRILHGVLFEAEGGDPLYDGEWIATAIIDPVACLKEFKDTFEDTEDADIEWKGV